MQKKTWSQQKCVCLPFFLSFPLHTSQPFQQIHQANQWLLFLRQPSPWYKCWEVRFTGFTIQKRGQKIANPNTPGCFGIYHCHTFALFDPLMAKWITPKWPPDFVRKPASRIGHVPNMSEETSTHQPLRCMKSHSLSCGLLDSMRRRVNSNDTVTTPVPLHFKDNKMHDMHGASFMTAWRNPAIRGNCLPSRESIQSIFMLGFLSLSSMIRLYRTRRVTPAVLGVVLCQTPRQIDVNKEKCPKNIHGCPTTIWSQLDPNWLTLIEEKKWSQCTMYHREMIHFTSPKRNTWRMHGCWGSLHRDLAHQSLDLCATNHKPATLSFGKAQLLKLQNLESHQSKNSKPPMLWNWNMLGPNLHSGGPRPFGPLGPNEFIRNPNEAIDLHQRSGLKSGSDLGSLHHRSWAQKEPFLVCFPYTYRPLKKG